MNRLITFRPSHYCEKARWALDRAGIPYREESHIPVFSWLATFRAGARRTVPVLVTTGRVIPDSTDILRWVDEQTGGTLFPDAESAALENDFDRGLGPAARRLVYFHTMPDRARLKAIVRASGPAWEARLTDVCFPLILKVIVRGLNISADGARRSLGVVDRTFAQVGARLADGRRWLTGDRFTAADLTFGALSYLVLWPEATVKKGLVPPLAEAPAAMRALVEKYRATAAGQFGMRTWEEERGTVISPHGGGP